MAPAWILPFPARTEKLKVSQFYFCPSVKDVFFQADNPIALPEESENWNGSKGINPLPLPENEAKEADANPIELVVNDSKTEMQIPKTESKEFTNILKEFNLDCFEQNLIPLGFRNIRGLKDLEKEDFQDLGFCKADRRRLKKLFEKVGFEWIDQFGGCSSQF